MRFIWVIALVFMSQQSLMATMKPEGLAEHLVIRLHQAPGPVHLVLQLQDDPNGLQWRKALIQQAQAPVDKYFPYPQIPLDQIAKILGLDESNLNLPFFQNTYGGSVRQVYESKILANYFDAAFYQMAAYLRRQDYESDKLELWIRDQTRPPLAFPLELLNFKKLTSLSIQNYLYYPNLDDINPDSSFLEEQKKTVQTLKTSNLNVLDVSSFKPFFRLFASHPILSKVTNLVMEYGTFPGYADGWFEGWQHLRTIKLLNSGPAYKRTSMDPGFYKLTEIEQLDLNMDMLMLDPECIKWTRLESLCLKGKEFSGSLPKEFEQLTTLKEFKFDFDSISNWSLMQVPPSLMKLRTLSVLDRNGDRFPIDYGPGQFPNLVSLCIPFVQAKTINDDFILPALTDLNMSFEGLEMLPQSLLQHPGLTRLSCILPKSAGLPFQLLSMTQLRALNVTTYGPVLPIGGMAFLEELSIHFRETSWNNFRLLTNLKSLKLFSGNGIMDFPSEVAQLTQLTRLEMQYFFRKGPLPPEMFNLKCLEQYYGVGSAPMFAAPDRPTQWIALRSMLLSVVSEIPESITGLINLETLQLQQGDYKLPLGMSKLTGLKTLYIWISNEYMLENLEIVYTIESLQNLSLLNCTCEVISPNIKYLRNLRKFHCWVYKLRYVAPSIGELANLAELSIHAVNSPDLTSFPSSLDKLTALQILDIRPFWILKALPPSFYERGVTILDYKD